MQSFATKQPKKNVNYTVTKASASELEHIGGGMDMEAVKNTMHDTEKRSKVAVVLRDYAKRLDQTVELLNRLYEIKT